MPRHNSVHPVAVLLLRRTSSPPITSPSSQLLLAVAPVTPSRRDCLATLVRRFGRAELLEHCILYTDLNYAEAEYEVRHYLAHQVGVAGGLRDGAVRGEATPWAHAVRQLALDSSDFHRHVMGGLHQCDAGSGSRASASGSGQPSSSSAGSMSTGDDLTSESMSSGGMSSFIDDSADEASSESLSEGEADFRPTLQRLRRRDGVGCMPR
jgi:hypothetical protein